jgi:hypothetical protein
MVLQASRNGTVTPYGDLYFFVVEVENYFVMWFLRRAAQTSTEAQQRLVYATQ